jgi:GntR family transcriptional regulator
MDDLLTVRPEEIPMTAPKYVRVADAIRDQIRSGQLKPGDRLPSTRELEAQFGVSYGSIRGAMLVLKAEGLVRGQPGEAVYVRGEVDAAD